MFLIDLAAAREALLRTGLPFPRRVMVQPFTARNLFMDHLTMNVSRVHLLSTIAPGRLRVPAAFSSVVHNMLNIYLQLALLLQQVLLTVIRYIANSSLEVTLT